MADILPRVEIYARAPREWRYRLIKEDGSTEEPEEQGNGVAGHPTAAIRRVLDVYPGVPILVLPEDA